MVCAMYSVSRVACIRAGRLYEDRELNDLRRDEETCVSRWVSTTESRADGADVDVVDERVEAEALEGMVVEISV